MTTTVLVTGSTGTLGTPTVDRLRTAGHDVRALSRRSGPGLVTGDLLTGEGIAAAVTGASVVVHLATGRRRKDVVIARTLFDAARAARFDHLVLMSIVGIDHIPLGYYRDKVEIEGLVARSGLPHTILRATQFFEFLRGIADMSTEGDVVRVTDAHLQPVAADDVVDALAELAAALINGDEAETTGTVTDPEGDRDVPSVLLTPISIFRDNVKDVVDDDFVTAEELCTGEFAAACGELGIE